MRQGLPIAGRDRTDDCLPETCIGVISFGYLAQIQMPLIKVLAHGARNPVKCRQNSTHPYWPKPLFITHPPLQAMTKARFSPIQYQRLGACLLLALCLGTAWQKAGAGVLPELFWLCHVTAWLLALSLLCGWRALSAVSCLLQLAVSIPAYLIYLAQGGYSHWTSIGVHLLAPMLGAYAWWARPWPRATAWWSLAAYFVLSWLSWLLTPERLNVNLVFHPAIFLPTLGESANRGLNWLLVLTLLWLWQWVWNNIAKLSH